MSWVLAAFFAALAAVLVLRRNRVQLPAAPSLSQTAPLERQLATLRAVVDGMAEGVWITSADGTVLQHNAALKQMLFSDQRGVGQRPVELLRSAELQEAVVKACEQGEATQLELTVDGPPARVLAIHVWALGKDLAGSAAVFFDVTSLRHLEKVRRDFVANVSHELRTPITAIRGYAETLLSGALQDPNTAQKMVEIIHRQSKSLAALVEDLLELSRIEGRQIQLQSEPVDLHAAATRAAEDTRPKALPKQIDVTLAIEPGLGAMADQRAVEQVLVNLLDNAIKYTPAGGKVRVSAEKVSTGVRVAVKDSGVGIEARHLSRIFERFYRVDKGRSRDMGGTGLGLSIVKHLVTAMSGEVRVESAPGSGTTFWVDLPGVK